MALLHDNTEKRQVGTSPPSVARLFEVSFHSLICDIDIFLKIKKDG